MTRKLGIPKLRVHDPRHVYATALLEGGAPINSIALLLGHASTRMTETYANRSPESLRGSPTQHRATRAARAAAFAAGETEGGLGLRNRL